MTNNPYDFDTGPFRHFCTSERLGLNLANSAHFARRHLGLCDRNVLTAISTCVIENESLIRCSCNKGEYPCCSGRMPEDEFCLACQMFCHKINPVPEVKTMDVKKYSKFIIAGVGAVLSILVVILTPNQYDTVSVLITSVLTALGVYQVPNKD